MKINYFIIPLLFIVAFTQCSTTEEEPTPPIELVAVISNPSQTVAPLTEVTLDGSQSTGPEGFIYEWISQGDQVGDLSSTSEPIVTFTPKVNGFYSFKLRLTSSDGRFNETSSQITVTGAVILETSIFDTNDRVVLTNIDSDPAMADYIINESFTIPVGKTLAIENGTDITIAMAENAGIIVNGSLSQDGLLTLTAQTSNWQGILVDGGTFTSNHAFYIKKAGNAAFENQMAAALIITNGGTLNFNNYSFIEENVADHGIIISPTASFNQILGGVQISGAKYPLMVDIAHLSSAITNGLSLSNYDYIHITTPGEGVTVGAIDGQFQFINYTFFIDGSFTAGSKILTSNSIIYMKEGAGIVGQDISVNSSTFQGLDNVTWKGLASTGLINLNSSDIIGAGSAVHNTGAFTSLEAAAIYSTNIVVLENSNFTNNAGFGVYVSSFNTSSRITSTTFTNTTGTDISLPFNIVGGFIKTGNSWSSTMPVELRSGQNAAGSSWKSLGTGNAYVVKDNILINTGALTLEPGVLLKFRTGKSLTVETKLTAMGTDNERILFNGVDDTPGSWAGILLQGQYLMEYCTIINGGGSTFIGAQAAANIVFGSGGGLTYPQSLYNFENNTVSLSADYGATILLNKYDPVTSATTNTFENNTNGDIKLP